MIVESSSSSTTLEANGAPDVSAVGVAEPDYRFTLANERTFLAWQRTALGLLAAAVGVVQFLPELAVPGLRHILGGAVGAVAMLTSAAGLHRWSQVDHAIRRDKPLPRPSTPIYLAVALITVGLVTVALALAAAGGGR
jgi:putative membrane protein